MNNSKKKKFDKLASVIVYSVGFIGTLILGLIITYVFITGFSLVSWDTITGDSATINTNVYLTEGPAIYQLDNDLDEEVY